MMSGTLTGGITKENGVHTLRSVPNERKDWISWDSLLKLATYFQNDDQSFCSRKERLNLQSSTFLFLLQTVWL